MKTNMGQFMTYKNVKKGIIKEVVIKQDVETGLFSSSTSSVDYTGEIAISLKDNVVKLSTKTSNGSTVRASTGYNRQLMEQIHKLYQFCTLIEPEIDRLDIAIIKSPEKFNGDVKTVTNMTYSKYIGIVFKAICENRVITSTMEVGFLETASEELSVSGVNKAVADVIRDTVFCDVTGSHLEHLRDKLGITEENDKLFESVTNSVVFKLGNSLESAVELLRFYINLNNTRSLEVCRLTKEELTRCYENSWGLERELTNGVKATEVTSLYIGRFIESLKREKDNLLDNTYDDVKRITKGCKDYDDKISSSFLLSNMIPSMRDLIAVEISKSVIRVLTDIQSVISSKLAEQDSVYAYQILSPLSAMEYDLSALLNIIMYISNFKTDTDAQGFVNDIRTYIDNTNITHLDLQRSIEMEIIRYLLIK